MHRNRECKKKSECLLNITCSSTQGDLFSWKPLPVWRFGTSGEGTLLNFMPLFQTFISTAHWLDLNFRRFRVSESTQPCRWKILLFSRTKGFTAQQHVSKRYTKTVHPIKNINKHVCDRWLTCRFDDLYMKKYIYIHPPSKNISSFSHSAIHPSKCQSASCLHRIYYVPFKEVLFIMDTNLPLGLNKWFTLSDLLY